VATGRIALLGGLVAALLSAALARGAGTTEDEMLLRAGLAFVLFALFTKAVASAVTYLVPELLEPGRPRKAAAAAGEGEAGQIPSGQAPPGGAQSGRTDGGTEGKKGGRLDVVLPGTSAAEMLNAGTGKEVAG
jgi:hypothetical protein